MNKIKTIDIAFIISIIFNQFKEKKFNYEDLREITFIDQSYRPEVAKVIKPTKKESFGKKEGEEKSKNLYEGSEEISPIDLTKKIEKSQGKIDFNYFPLAKEEGMDIIRIPTNNKVPTKTIDELLKEEPIKLSGSSKKGSGISFGVYSEITEKEPINLETKILKKEKKIELEEKEKEEIKLLPKETKKTEIAIAGPISERKIIKKVLPKYPNWAVEKGISGYVVLKIWVTPEGKVENNIEIIESSGYPQLDKIVSEALAYWLFEPLAEEVKKEMQWGIIKFKFELL